ncbi:MAG: hypothetical protein HY691_12825 [Chloroflexi bacterium]|nr:hypothetical protein [Chloroflexota bacterium]
MRVQITVPDPLWRRLCEAAAAECRYPRQQLELIVRRALAALRPKDVPGAPTEVER